MSVVEISGLVLSAPGCASFAPKLSNRPTNLFITRHNESKSQFLQDLSAAQVTAFVERSGLGPQQLSARLGCGTSQLFKYQHELGIEPLSGTVKRGGTQLKEPEA